MFTDVDNANQFEEKLKENNNKNIGIVIVGLEMGAFDMLFPCINYVFVCVEIPAFNIA